MYRNIKGTSETLIAMYFLRRFVCELELPVSNTEVHHKQNTTGSMPGNNKYYDGTRNSEGESELAGKVCLLK
jgi:hypothetical protein